MARDALLKLYDGATSGTSEILTPPVDTEGGFRADVVMFIGAVTGTSPTLTARVQASIDGTSYSDIAQFPTMTGANSQNTKISRSVYIPHPAAGQAATKVRLSLTPGGTAPVWNLRVFVEPLVSIAVEATDSERREGLARLV